MFEILASKTVNVESNDFLLMIFSFLGVLDGALHGRNTKEWCWRWEGDLDEAGLFVIIAFSSPKACWVVEVVSLTWCFLVVWGETTGICQQEVKCLCWWEMFLEQEVVDEVETSSCWVVGTDPLSFSFCSHTLEHFRPASFGTIAELPVGLSVIVS